MNVFKGRGATISFVTALLALVGVQAYAFSHSHDQDDSFQPAAAAEITSPAAQEVSTTETSAPAETTPEAQSEAPLPVDTAAQPQITGAPLDDDNEGEEEGEEEESDD